LGSGSSKAADEWVRAASIVAVMLARGKDLFARGKGVSRA
jgi:hypothetical protein